VDAAVTLTAEVGQGRFSCFVRVLPAGMTDQKWLILMVKDQNMVKNPPTRRKPTENAITQTNILDVEPSNETESRERTRSRIRNSTWTIGEVDLNQNSMEEALQLFHDREAHRGTGRALSRGMSRNSAGLNVGDSFNDQASLTGSRGFRNWNQQISSEQDREIWAPAASSFALAENSRLIEPTRSTSFPAPLNRGNRASVSSPRVILSETQRSATLSLSVSVSQASCSHTWSSASKARRTEEASCQTDIVYTKLGWHCRACSRPPKPEGAPSGQPKPPGVPERRRLPSMHSVAAMQGGWKLSDGPPGVAEWLQEFVISGTTVHSRSHHFPLLEGASGSGIEMAGGMLELRSDGVLIRHGKSGHQFLFRRSKDIEVICQVSSNNSSSDRDTGDQDYDSLSRAVSLLSRGSLRIGNLD